MSSQSTHAQPNPRLGAALEAPESHHHGLHFVNLDFLGDTDQALLVCGPTSDQQYHVRVYRQRDLDRVRDVREDEALRVLDMGRPVERDVPSTRNAARDDKDKEPQTETDASLQTELEAQFSGSTELLGQVQGMFNDFKVGACPDDWQPKVEQVTLPIIEATGVRHVPAMIVAHTCFFGNQGVFKTTLPIQDPIFGGSLGDRIRSCSTQFKVTDTRKLSLKHSMKSTKIGFGFGLGFMPNLPVPPVPTMPIDVSPKKGDKAFQNGQPKKDPATGSNVNFNFELVKTHAKLKIDAWQRLVLDVGPDMFVCHDA